MSTLIFSVLGLFVAIIAGVAAYIGWKDHVIPAVTRPGPMQEHERRSIRIAMVSTVVFLATVGALFQLWGV